MKNNNGFVCSKCGHLHWLLQGEVIDYENPRCKYCNGLLLDIGVPSSKYILPRDREYIMETIIIPYGQFDQDEYDRTEQKIAERNSTFPNVNIKSTVSCPYCKSTNTSKIGVVGRSVSIGLFGLASGKVGKQWKCNSCGSCF